jgi:L-iditol 2-dehydrogenase
MECAVVRLHGRYDLRLHREPLPDVGSGELLVRVGAVGICGSDLHWLDEASIGDAKLAQPLVLGHEFAGTIESGPRQGVRVAVDPAIPCGACPTCLQGNPNLCPQTRFAGHSHQDGALRQFLPWPQDLLIPLPEALSLEDGAMLEPLGVALFSTDLVKLKVGMQVGVFGAGPIGLLLLQLALRSAVTVYATDVLPHRVQAAADLGARAFLDADGKAAGAIFAASGDGLDVAFEVAGDNAAVEAACRALKPGGHLILVGIPASDKTIFTASLARRKGLTIKLVRRMKHTYPRALSLVEHHQIEIGSLITHRFPLKDAGAAFAHAARREGIKTIIVP